MCLSEGVEAQKVASPAWETSVSHPEPLQIIVIEQ